MELPYPVRALKYPNFRLFFGGQLISLVGTWMQTVAQAWLVYRLTGSSVLLGAVSFSQQFPIFFLAPFGGAVADRCNRHRVVIATQSLSMVISFVFAALALTGTIQVWHIFVLAAMLGSVNAFDIAARQSLVVGLVDRSDLMNAIALNSTILNVSRIAGPAIAGVLVARIGEGWCVFGNGVSFIAVIAGLLLMKMPPHVRTIARASSMSNIAQGYRYLTQHHPIWNLLALVGVVNLMTAAVSVLMPLFADRILKGGAPALGTLMTATGTGALCGALFLAPRTSLKGLSRWVAAAAMIFGASAIAFAASRRFGLSLVLLVPVGFGAMLLLGGSNTLLQSMVPDEMRGRAMAVHSMMVSGMASFGALLAGWEAAHWGAPVTVAVNASFAMLAGAVFWWRIPLLREQAWSLIRAQHAHPSHRPYPL